MWLFKKKKTCGYNSSAFVPSTTSAGRLRWTLRILGFGACIQLNETRGKNLKGNRNCIGDTPVNNLGIFSDWCELIVFRYSHRTQKLMKGYENGNEQNEHIPEKRIYVFNNLG